MRTLAVTNAKGGVGKSTTAINLAAALVELDQRVLLIDADPSGNATLGFFPREIPTVGLADALLENLQLDQVALATTCHNLDLIPPGDRLSTCSEQMGSIHGLGQGREFRIRRLLKGLSGYDVVIVDTSPVLTPLNVAILYAVAEIIIPIDPCIAALAGVRALEDLIKSVSEFRLEFTDAGPLTIVGVLITRADRTLVSKQIESEVRAYFGPVGLRTSGPGVSQIPRSLRTRDSTNLLRSLQPRSRGLSCSRSGLPPGGSVNHQHRSTRQ